MKIRFIYNCAAVAMLAGASLTSCSDPFDPSYLEEQIKGLQTRVESLENNLKGINQSITSLQSLVSALDKGIYVVSVDPADKGFKVTFSDGTVTTINVASEPSTPSDPIEVKVPEIGVELVDGVYYWTIDGEFLLGKDGEKLPVSGADGADGKDGEDGEDGKDATAPVIGVKNVDGTLYWTVNGEYLLDENGKKVVASYPEPTPGQPSELPSDSIFKSVNVSDGAVKIELTDGTAFELPMKSSASLRIEATKLHFADGERKSVHVNLNGITGITVADKPEGWRAKIDGSSLSIQAPVWSTAIEDEGDVTVLATSGDQTFIGKVRVTMDDPIFAMNVSPNGVMTLTELDSDFNSPGYWAGFVKASEFDPAKIVEPAKQYTPQSGEDFYDSWNSATEGKSINVKISSSLSPVVGETYAAYCFPGYYSKWIGTDPDPANVYVRYFTYVEENFTLSNLGVDKATVNVSFDGASSFYGGIIRWFADDDVTALAEMFLEDAMAPISGLGDGMRGVLMKGSYSGALNMFAALDDGEGHKNAKSIVPGGKYAIALIPVDPNKNYSDYTIDDVIIEPVVLNTPSQSGTEMVSVNAGPSTTTTASVSFDITSSVSKFYYTLATKAEFEASGLSAYDFVTRYGIVWDRAILKASGAISDIGTSCTGLKPGQECIAIGAGFTTGGSYSLVTMDLAASEVVLSDGTVSVKNMTLENINANSTKVTFQMSCSSSISKIRYMDRLSVEEFETEYGSEDAVYETLTAGSRWSYEEVGTRDDIVMYIYPEAKEYVLFAVGVDVEGKFTELVKYTFKPVE